MKYYFRFFTCLFGPNKVRSEIIAEVIFLVFQRYILMNDRRGSSETQQ